MGRVLVGKLRRVGEMRKILRFLLVFLLCTTSANALGDYFVWDQATQYLTIPKLVEEAGLLTQQLNNLIQQVKYTQQELAQLGNYNWNTSQSVINQLGNQVNQANTLAYSAGNIDSNFRKIYPGYQTNPTASYANQYQNIVTTTQNTLNSILQSMGLSAADFANENTRMQALQNQAQNADGQTKAIQAASQIASAEVEQLQLLRQTVIAQTNAQTAYYAAQVQKEENSRADMSKIIQSGSSNITGKLDEHPLDLPKF